VAITKGAGAAAAKSVSEAREIPAPRGTVGAKSPVAPPKRLCRPKAIPDSVYPGMWRVRWPDGSVSDFANLTRVNDAIACFMESAERRQRRHGPRRTVMTEQVAE
jgi:hypothetical protein